MRNYKVINKLLRNILHAPWYMQNSKFYWNLQKETVDKTSKPTRCRDSSTPTP